MGSYVATLIATFMGCHGACKQQHCHVCNPTKSNNFPNGSPSSLMALSNGCLSCFLIIGASVQKAKVFAAFLPLPPSSTDILLWGPSGS